MSGKRAARVENVTLQQEADSIARLIAAETIVLRGYTTQQSKASARGYSASRNGMRAVALLSGRSFGVELAKRLKDAQGKFPDEVFWWGRLLGRLAQENEFSGAAVSFPPSSEKQTYYLAKHLAVSCAKFLNVPCVELFKNLAPRRHRASLQEKLREIKKYELIRPYLGSDILLVDDVIQTGRTLLACANLLPPQVKIYAVLLAGG